jgi:hypothetical protein
MTFDFHKHDITRPLTKLKKKGVDNIKMDYLLWPRMKVVCPPLADVQKHLAVNKYQQSYATTIFYRRIPRKLESAGCFRTNRGERATHPRGKCHKRNHTIPCCISSTHAFCTLIHTSISTSDQPLPLPPYSILLMGAMRNQQGWRPVVAPVKGVSEIRPLFQM